MGEETVVKNMETLHFRQFFLTLVLLGWFFSKACHKISKAGIHKINNGEKVKKGYAIFRLSLSLIFFLLILLLVVAYFNYRNSINNDEETNHFFVFLRQVDVDE